MIKHRLHLLDFMPINIFFSKFEFQIFPPILWKNFSLDLCALKAKFEFHSIDNSISIFIGYK